MTANNPTLDVAAGAAAYTVRIRGSTSGDMWIVRAVSDRNSSWRALGEWHAADQRPPHEDTSRAGGEAALGEPPHEERKYRRKPQTGLHHRCAMVEDAQSGRAPAGHRQP